MSAVRSRRGAWCLLAVVSALSTASLSGCGGSDARESNPRPPSPIDIAVVIGEDEVDASPAKFGAGPIVLMVSNQSNASRTLTIEGSQVRQSVGPINPQDTATLKVSVRPGEYTLAAAAGSSDLKPAKLTVGPERPSAQNELLRP
jgi:hypothetical protein